MISAKKVLANRENAKKSTGPRTATGKSRASRNAMRHGLESISLVPTGYPERITQIANKLCENDPFPFRYEVALAIAESQVLLERIRTIRASIISKRKTGIQASRPAKPGSGISDEQSTALSELASLERYERRALARKRRAIRKFDALQD